MTKIICLVQIAFLVGHLAIARGFAIGSDGTGPGGAAIAGNNVAFAPPLEPAPKEKAPPRDSKEGRRRRQSSRSDANESKRADTEKEQPAPKENG